MKDRHKLVYLEACLYETMRLGTAAAVGVPHCTLSDSQVGKPRSGRDTPVGKASSGKDTPVGKANSGRDTHPCSGKDTPVCKPCSGRDTYSQSVRQTQGDTYSSFRYTGVFIFQHKSLICPNKGLFLLQSICILKPFWWTRLKLSVKYYYNTLVAMESVAWLQPIFSTNKSEIHVHFT